CTLTARHNVWFRHLSEATAVIRGIAILTCCRRKTTQIRAAMCPNYSSLATMLARRTSLASALDTALVSSATTRLSMTSFGQSSFSHKYSPGPKNSILNFSDHRCHQSVEVVQISASAAQRHSPC